MTCHYARQSSIRMNSMEPLAMFFFLDCGHALHGIFDHLGETIGRKFGGHRT